MCGGEHCEMVYGQCKCPQRDTAWPVVEPLVPPPITEIEGEPTAIPTPTEISSTGNHPTLEPRAVDGTEPHHTLSPRDNEEERRKPTGEGLCQHKERDCTRWHGILLPTEGAAISKRDIGHPTLSHRNNEAEPTITQTSTTTHYPTPTTFPGPCDPGDENCLIEYLELYDSCDASDTNCFLNFINTEEGSPTPPAAVIKCPKDDPRCPHSLLRPLQLEEDRHKRAEMVCPMDNLECQNAFDLPLQPRKGPPGSGTPACTAGDPECSSNKRSPPGDLPLVDPSLPAPLPPTVWPYQMSEDPVTVDSQDEDPLDEDLLDEDSLDEDPWAKAEKEEKRDVDIVLPTATGTSELKPGVDCVGMPWLCL